MPPKKINQISGMPQMSAAFAGWTQTLTLTKITQTIVDGLISQSESTKSYSGTWQPLSAEEVALKPDGQRAWAWYDLHIEGTSAPFAVNDRVKYDNVVYKIMAVKDYSLNNYSEYHIVVDYQD